MSSHGVIWLAGVLSVGGAPRISEIRIDQPGTDLDEYFELTGPPAGALTGLTYVVIGDLGPGNSGVIDAAIDLAGQTLDDDGFFVAAEPMFSLGTIDLVTTLNFENGDNVTHLLVSGFTGARNEDLDADDDGVLEVIPWTEVLDCVALVAGAGDHVYCPTRVGPHGSGVPAHAYRCEPAVAWRVGAADPIGGDDTPGADNPPCVCPADLDGNDVVDVVDFFVMLAGWGVCPSCPGDVDVDGVIGILDFFRLIADWGPCP
jgi:hypothetical protein